jgi:hypothetical protein
MRKTYVQAPDGKLIPKDEYHRPESTGPAIVGDMEPYQSTITGETITGRAAHREHLRKHGHEEVGDQMPKFLREKYERDGIKPRFDRRGRRIG